MRRSLSDCRSRDRPLELLAEAGVSYIKAVLDLVTDEEEEKEDEECVEQEVCMTARHVAGLSDKDGLVDNLNKILIKALALYLMEARHILPDRIISAGDWGRAWQDCHQRYKCSDS